MRESNLSKSFNSFPLLCLFVLVLFYTSCKNEGSGGLNGSSSSKVDESKYDLNLICSNGYKINAKYKGEDELDLVLTQDTLPTEEHEMTLSPSGSGIRYRNEDRSILFWVREGDYAYEVNNREICKCYDPSGEPMKSLDKIIFEDKLFAQSDKYPIALNNLTPLFKLERDNKATYYDSEKTSVGTFELKEGIIRIFGTNNDTLITLEVRGASHLIDQNKKHWGFKL